MAKRQMLKNSISYSDGVYQIKYFAEVDGIEKEIGEFRSESLAEVVAARELLANLPNLAAKLDAIVDLENWFREQLKKLEQRIKNTKTKKVKKVKSEEDKDAILRDFLKKLNK